MLSGEVKEQGGGLCGHPSNPGALLGVGEAERVTGHLNLLVKVWNQGSIWISS